MARRRKESCKHFLGFGNGQKDRRRATFIFFKFNDGQNKGKKSYKGFPEFDDDLIWSRPCEGLAPTSLLPHQGIPSPFRSFNEKISNWVLFHECGEFSSLREKKSDIEHPRKTAANLVQHSLRFSIRVLRSCKWSRGW